MLFITLIGKISLFSLFIANVNARVPDISSRIYSPLSSINDISFNVRAEHISELVNLKVLNSKENDIKISMDGRGRALDNIFVERLWRSVKYECIFLKDFDTVSSVHDALQEYFDYYNHERFHQSLNYKRPAEIYLP